MSKPDWKDAPEWAMWLAMDENHIWWWHQMQPSCLDSHWASDGFVIYAHGGKPNLDWYETLERRP